MIEDYVTSLGKARMLEKAGYPQDTHFYWFAFHAQQDIELRDKYHTTYFAEIDVAAPLPCELLQKLPDDCRHGRLEIEKSEDYWALWIKKGEINFQDEKLADCLADMWLYLKKEGLI